MVTEKIKDHINSFDRFAELCGIRLTRVEPGYAEAEMEISPRLLNGRGFVQGGAVFTLADIAFTGAANSDNDGMVTRSADLTFLRPGSGSRLVARAKLVGRGKTAGLYRVEVLDDREKLVAFGVVNGFATGQPLVEES